MKVQWKRIPVKIKKTILSDLKNQRISKADAVELLLECAKGEPAVQSVVIEQKLAAARAKHVTATEVQRLRSSRPAKRLRRVCRLPGLL